LELPPIQDLMGHSNLKTNMIDTPRIQTRPDGRDQPSRLIIGHLEN
jgi:hypothetical protein